jgi:hypothetical protein
VTANFIAVVCDFFQRKRSLVFSIDGLFEVKVELPVHHLLRCVASLFELQLAEGHVVCPALRLRLRKQLLLPFQLQVLQFALVLALDLLNLQQSFVVT